MKFFRTLRICCVALLIFQHAGAQTYSNKVVGEKNAELIDSLKSTEYPYVLPILGKKAAKAGFDLPYSAGISINYLHQNSKIIINNLEVGFNNGPKQSLDEIIRFNDATSESDGINFRPDVWLLPFLNIYGIFARSKTSTSIDASINVPDSDSWNEIATFQTKAEFDAMSMGFGLTPTIGVGGGWIALDMNFTWSDIEELDKPVYAFIFDPRIGKSFKLKNQQALAVWVGGFRLMLNSGTSGSLPLNQLFDTQGLEAKVDNGIATVAESQQQVEAWWNGLTPPQQNNPANKAKYETATRVLDKSGEILESFSEAIDRPESSSVQYSLDKRQKDLWNFMVGAQYQYNKHWMLRAEFGFLTARSHFIGGLQYRFGL